MIEQLQAEYLNSPMAFIGGVAGTLSFVFGSALALLSMIKPTRIGPVQIAISGPQFRAMAAPFLAVSIAMACGLCAGFVMRFHWLAGFFAATILAFFAAIWISAAAGRLLQPWIHDVGSIRQQGESNPPQWFIGLSSLDELTARCCVGIAWLTLIGIAFGVAEPWISAIANLRDESAIAFVSIISLIGAAFIVGISIEPINKTSTMIFTAQAGISWSDATPATPPQNPAPIKSARKTRPRPASPKKHAKGAAEA